MLFLFHRFYVVVHGLPAHALVKVEQCGIELRTVHARESGLSTHRDTAGPAHARAVHHQGVKADHTRDIEFGSFPGHELHHDHRSDGYAGIIMLTLCDQIGNDLGDHAMTAIASVIRGDVEILGNFRHLLLHDHEIFRFRANDGICVEAVLTEPFYLRIYRRRSETAGHE